MGPSMNIEPGTYLSQYTEYENLTEEQRQFFSKNAHEFQCFEFIDGFYVHFGYHNGQLWMSNWDKSFCCYSHEEWPYDYEHFLYRDAHKILELNRAKILEYFGESFSATAVLVSNKIHKYTNHNPECEKFIILDNYMARCTFPENKIHSYSNIRNGLDNITQHYDVFWRMEFQRTEHSDFYSKIYPFIMRTTDPLAAKRWVSQIHNQDSRREPPGLIFKHPQLSFVLLSGVYLTYKSLVDAHDITLYREDGEYVVDRLYRALEQNDIATVQKCVLSMTLFSTKWSTANLYSHWTKMMNNQRLYAILQHVNRHLT